MEMIFCLFGFALTAYLVPLLSEVAKLHARHLFSTTKKSLPNPSTNVEVVIFVMYYQ